MKKFKNFREFIYSDTYKKAFQPKDGAVEKGRRHLLLPGKVANFRNDFKLSAEGIRVLSNPDNGIEF